MLKRLEELRRAASNSELRAAYQAAIDGLDGVLSIALPCCAR
jgi:hypothetical protein